MTLHKLNAIELDDTLIEAGFPKVDVIGTTSPKGLYIRRTAWAKAMAESGGYYDIISPQNPNGSYDYGLFQINTIHKAALGVDWALILNPVFNANLAWQWTDDGRAWGTWGLGMDGWAGSLYKTNNEAWKMIQAAFQKWYDAYPAAIAEAKRDMALPTVHIAYLVYGMGGSGQPAKKPDIIAYQKALRVYLTLHTSAANVAALNPNGATGYFGRETQAMTTAVYKHKAAETNNLSWLRGDLTTPGPGMLNVIGLRAI